jgi:predicted O-methyltransferase YrrM
MENPIKSLWEKTLPNQMFNSELYQGERPFEASLYEILSTTAGYKDPSDELVLTPSPLFPTNHMASSPVVLHFLQWLIKFGGLKNIVEIGTFIGVSAMYFAKAVPESGKVVSIEKFKDFADLAKKNIEENGLQGKISVIVGSADDVASEVGALGPFDMLFIDGHKEAYMDYLIKYEPYVRSGGVIIVDDALFHGDVLNETPSSEKGAGVKACLDYASKLTNWTKTFVPISNGVLILTKP